MRICLIEDNDLLREMLRSALVDEGFIVGAAADAEGLGILMAREGYDAFVVDLNLPGEDGLSIARRLKAVQPETFIIMATARERVSDRVTGYEHGADIYMTKPVHVRELVAALHGHRQRLLKRSQENLEQDLEFDAVRLTLRRGAQSCRLSPAEATLLKGMATAPAQQIDYWQLFDLLDKSPTEANKRVLEVHVVNLRKKLVQLGLESGTVQVVRGQGYRLLCPIRLIQA